MCIWPQCVLFAGVCFADGWSVLLVGECCSSHKCVLFAGV